MVEISFDLPLEPAALADLFQRAGWRDPATASVIDWALAASENWVTVVVDDELVGFGRTFLLDVQYRMVCDVVVDVRFEGLGIEAEIIRRLAATAGSFEEVVLFRRPDIAGGESDAAGDHANDYGVPAAPPDCYLG